VIKVSSWGRLESPLHSVISLQNRNNVASAISANKPGLAYGMGRSYGDVCLNPNGVLWHTRGLDRFIEFNSDNGRLICEAGTLLSDIQQLTIPRGWALPVTPGTELATVGGAIANDVHGKNHHRLGTFGHHIKCITLIRSDGEEIICGPELETQWFHATIGGLGLTGIITKAEIQLRKIQCPWFDAETIPYANLDEFFDLADISEEDWEHTVSWFDCTSGTQRRGIFMRANPADSHEYPEPVDKRLNMPVTPPITMINRLTVLAFNAAYYNLNKIKAGKQIVHYKKFLYPLDNVHHWNRVYGTRGFYQYQSVVPRESGQQIIELMLKEISRCKEGSFLAVLKTFGDQPSIGMLSFPRPGVTLALDFPNRGARTLELFENLDALVREAGGCLYPAKDARMPRDLFESGYPRLNEFMKYRDPGISSAFSRRLMGS